MNTPSRTQWGGRYRALVVDDRDPLHKMRVKVRIPDFMIAAPKYVGKWDTNGLWASPSNNYLGGRTIQDTKIRHKGPDAYYQGSCLIPPKGTHVWVWFEKNDISHPFYDGAAEYGDVQSLPENQLGTNYQKKWTLLKTCQGRCLVISDDDDDARFEITGKKRMIKDPPFGDTDSVYKIDNNQSVFLIDERPQHEKILLKDYRGNFMKLIQDENGINDQLHVKIQNDVHMEFQKDFYLTVLGNMHVKVLGDIYVTSLKDIFVNATLKLQEKALSIDRFATTYDNTYAGLINNKSLSNINSSAVIKIFEQSTMNVRNSMVTSDVSTGLTSIKAGAAIGILAGGAVSIYGGGGTAIQSTPVSMPLSGSVDTAKSAPTATEAKPDPERYEKIIFGAGAPNLTTPTGKDSLTGDSTDHGNVPTSQCASSQVGGKGGGASSCGGNGGNNAASCCGGNTSDGSGTCQGASSAKSGSCNGGGNGGSPLLNSDSDVPNLTFDNSDSSNIYTTTAPTVSECCSNVFNNTMNGVVSGLAAIDSMLGLVDNIVGGIIDNVYSNISGIDTITEPYTYNTQFTNQIYEQSSLQYAPYYNNVINDVANVLMHTINDDLEVTIPVLDEIPYRTYDSLYDNYVYLERDYPNTVNNQVIGYASGCYSEIVPDTTYYATNLLDSILTLMNDDNHHTEDIFKDALVGVINGVIDSFVYDFADGYVNTCYQPLYDDYFTHVTPFNDYNINTIDQYTNDECISLRDNICGIIDASSHNVIDHIADAINIEPVPNEVYLTTDQLLNNLLLVQNLVSDFNELCNNNDEIEKFKEDPDRIETLKNDLIINCKNSIRETPLSNDEVNKKFAIVNNTMSDTIEKSLTPLTIDADKETIDRQVANINNIIVSDLEKDNYSLTSDFTQFQEDSKTLYSTKLSEKIKSDYQDKINQLVKDIPVKESRDTATMAHLKDEIQSFVSSMGETLGEEGIIAKVVTKDDIEKLTNDLHDNVKQHYPTKENNTAKQALEDFKNQLQTDINNNRKESLGKIFDLDTSVDNQFSKYSTQTYNVPSEAGCGYYDTLYLNDKYRKTLLPLTSFSGGNAFSFVIVSDTSKLKYESKQVWNQETGEFTEYREYHPFYDTDAIVSYEKMWNDLREGKSIDTTTKWWSNLKQVLTDCSIYNIVCVITLLDFRDATNPFTEGVAENKVYTDSMWRDDFEGKFLSTLYSFIRETQARVIYNIGYRSYQNSYDLECEKYKIYPNCGYLRRLIMWSVYKCELTSNIMGLTANTNNNLYYYNPYCEWKVYDDGNDYDLDTSQIFIRYSVDGKTNDDADIVTYNKGKINGGYAKCLTNSDKYCIVVFCMDDLISKIPVGADINDPNIMSNIFCKNSRTALRYFKGNNYFDFEELHFDENGDVI